MSPRQIFIFDSILAFLCGTAVFYGIVKMNFWVYVGAAILIWLVIKYLRSNVRHYQLVIILILVFIGVARGYLDIDRRDLSFLDQQKVTMVGDIVYVNPSSRLKNEVRVLVNRIKDGKNMSSINFLVRLSVPTFEYYKIGEKVQITGILKARGLLKENRFWPYLYKERIDFNLLSPRIKKIFSQYNLGDDFLNLLNRWKSELVGFYRQNLSTNTAAFIIGILIGQKADFSKQVLANFSNTGLSHVLAISGFNIVLIIGVLERVLEKRITKKSRFILMGILIGIFTIFTGASASVVRAALMGMISLFIKYNGKKMRRF